MVEINLKLIIRKAKAGDEIGIANIFKIGLKRKNFLYTGTNKLISKKQLQKMREGYNLKEKIEFVAIKSNNIIGSCSFESNKGRTKHSGRMGWIVHPDYQNKGVCSELLKTTLDFAKKKGFKRAEGSIAVENKASLKLVKNFGFLIEGKMRKAFLTDDKRYIDLYVVGKLL